RSTSVGTFTIVPGTTTTVSGNRVLFTVDAANLTTNYYYTIGTSDNLAGPLPIQLVSFAGVKDGNNVKLNWKTASEENNDYFDVEKSSNAISFGKLVQVDSKAPGGNSLTNLFYETFDNVPAEGNNYYRLKQV